MKEGLEARIVQRIEGSTLYDIGPYKYFVWPYKGLTGIDPSELSYLVDQLAQLVPDGTEALASFMVDGAILATPLSIRLERPLLIFRDNAYNLTRPVKIRQKTRYFSRDLFIDTPKRGTIICLVDAIISSGATAIAAAEGCRSAGCVVNQIVAAVSKPEYRGIEAIKTRLGISAEVLFSAMTRDGRLSLERATK